MSLRRLALPVVVIAVLAVACGGENDEGSNGIELEQPIGAPESDPNYESSSGGSVETGPPVVKQATLDMEVAHDELNSTAQEVVELATSPKVGGFLVSSTVDLRDGYGTGSVTVQVPSPRFEGVVGELSSVGDLTRQQLQGQDLTPDFLANRARLNRTRKQTAGLIGRLERSDDQATKFQLRAELRESRELLRSLRTDERYIQTQTAYSSIAVSLAAKQPPPPPEKTSLEQALVNAKSIALGIASGAILTAGIVLPIGALALVLYLAGAPLFRRLRPRWSSDGL